MILINKWALNFKNHYFWQCATISSSASRSPSPTLRSLWFVWMSSFTAIGKTPAFTICQYENKWTLNFECHMTTPLLLDKPYHTRSASLAFCQPKCYICTCICYIQHLNFLCLDWNNIIVTLHVIFIFIYRKTWNSWTVFLVPPV